LDTSTGTDPGKVLIPDHGPNVLARKKSPNTPFVSNPKKTIFSEPPNFITATGNTGTGNYL
jgi:hypothetical protein